MTSTNTTISAPTNTPLTELCDDILGVIISFVSKYYLIQLSKTCYRLYYMIHPTTVRVFCVTDSSVKNFKKFECVPFVKLDCDISYPEVLTTIPITNVNSIARLDLSVLWRCDTNNNNNNNNNPTKQREYFHKKQQWLQKWCSHNLQVLKVESLFLFEGTERRNLLCPNLGSLAVRSVPRYPKVSTTLSLWFPKLVQLKLENIHNLSTLVDIICGLLPLKHTLGFLFLYLEDYPAHQYFMSHHSYKRLQPIFTQLVWLKEVWLKTLLTCE